MEFKYVYSFQAETTCYIFEIKHTNVPSNAPKEMQYQWYIKYTPNEMYKLIFLDSTKTTRTFKGNIKLDLEKNKIIWVDEEFELEKCLENVEVISMLLGLLDNFINCYQWYDPTFDSDDDIIRC